MAPLLEVRTSIPSTASIEALKGVSLTVEEGEIVTLIGSNGAGKSTTLRVDLGSRRPGAGTIEFRGDEISHGNPRRRSCA